MTSTSLQNHSSMEISGDDLPPPESWEIADLDAAVIRLMLSSDKSPATAPDAVDDPAAPPATLSPADSVSPDDASNQVDQFLREALQNPRERLSILRMEQDVLKFIRDPSQQQLVFQQLPTSYLRLAAHRVAQHYSLQSTVMLDNSSPDGSASRIVVHKGSECRLPPIRLVDIPVNLPQEDSNNVVKVAIKQRPQKNSQTTNSACSSSSKENQLKSVEERKEEYNRARARIFSGGSGGSGGLVGKSEAETILFDNCQHCSSSSTRLEERPSIEVPEVNLARTMADSSTSSSSSGRLSRNRGERESGFRGRANNRVAIFRDREVDRKDPDYDRSYDRYMQRFDPGFGFSGGQYNIQPMYSPVLNYNTEFPQLGSAHRPQLSIEQPRPMPQHLRGPWTPSSSPTAIGFPAPPERMLAPPPFNPNHIGAPSTSPVYLHSQYPCPRPGMAFVHPPEHVHQPFAQSHHQKSEASFGLARPR